MKILSVAIPCYNSAEYMSKCIESLLPAGDDIEILIVDDGSAKDNTLEIAREYEAKNPGIVRAIHQENAGHGGAVNKGISEATGIYFKNIDSDDWADTGVLLKIIGLLKGFVEKDTRVDLVLADFVFDKVGVKEQNKKVMRLTKSLPVGEVFGWDDVKKVTSQYIMMHNIIYRRDVLLESGLKLPEHTFYCDNIYAYQPLPNVKTMYYIDEALYRYYIGREGQSVSEEAQLRNIDQQIRVDKIMTDVYASQDASALGPKLGKYMLSYLTLMYCATTSILLIGGTDEHLKKLDDLWKYLELRDPRAYKKIKGSFMGGWMTLPGKLGRKMSVGGYRIVQKLYKFN